MKFFIILIIAISMLLAACGSAQVPITAPCSEQAAEFVRLSAPIIADFQKAADNLQLTVLRSIPQKIENIPAPECAKFYKASILTYMYKMSSGDSTWDKAFGDFLNAGMCLNKPDKDPAAPAACYAALQKN